MVDTCKSPKNDPDPAELTLSLDYAIDGECLIAICKGQSRCESCLAKIYVPILNKLEDTSCTGLVLDKRGITCSGDRESMRLIADMIMRYKNRSPLRKMALVSNIEYIRDEELLQTILFDKGLNIRIFSDLVEAKNWAGSYP